MPLITKSNMQSVAAGADFDIRPSSGEEWIIHNIRWSGAVALKEVNGSNVLQYDTDGSAGGRLGLTEHLTNTQFLRVTNTTAGAILVSYSGIRSDQ